MNNPTTIYIKHKALASDPNTSPSTLFNLLEHYPVEVLTNPVFPLLAIECPDMAYELSTYARLQILLHEDIAPDWLITQILVYRINMGIIDRLMEDDKWNIIRDKYPIPEGKLINLSFMIIEDCYIVNQNLSYCDFTSTSFKNVDIRNVDFSNSNLNTSTFRDCNVYNSPIWEF